MSRTIISLCGRKRTGKESAYKLLVSYVKGPKEFQFATPLKKYCMEVLGLTHDQCYGPTEDRESPTKYFWRDISPEIMEKYDKNPDDRLTARDVLQVVGTDLMRLQFYTDVWADAGIYSAINSTATTAIFTDSRFPNEVDACRRSPQMSDKFTKPIIIRLYRDTGLVDSHDSETALDKLDAIPGQRHLYFNDQESYSRGILVKMGYQKINDSLWKSISEDSGFDYLVDNNHCLETLKENMIYILKDRDVYYEPTLS